MALTVVFAFGARAAEAPVALTVAGAVAAALEASPELLDAVDQTALARANLSGVRSLFLPQLTPYFQRTVGSGDGKDQTRFGAFLSEQLLFGTRLTGSVDAASPSDGSGGYVSSYSLTLRQPLLKGADPAVTREPLRSARRLVDTSTRSLAQRRRQTVVLAWAAYLDVVLEEELVTVASERVGRAERLVEASEAKLEAGSVSRLDVLRARQLAASARSQENDARNFRDDAHDALTRLTGRPPGTRFLVTPPQALPIPVPEEEAAIAFSVVHREDLLEQRDRVRDAEIALRISRSLLLPSLDALGAWSTSGSATGIFDALTTPGKPSLSLGFASQVDMNRGLLFSQRDQAEISLRTARRAAALREDDVVRAVRQAARRLRTARERLAIDQANLDVARTQLEVASLRYEKGLSDNFNVVDAENLFNSARVGALTSRQAVLLAELDLLAVSGILVPEDFTPPK